MRISALADRSGVPVGTIKYYLREGLLAPGERTSRTTAEYDDSHVERLRLVRALIDTGGLGIAAVRRIVDVLDTPEPARLDVLGTAQDALLLDEPGAARGPSSEARAADEAPSAGSERATEPSRARAWLTRRGWYTYEDDLLIARLERVWEACEAAGVVLDDVLMDGYAQALEQVALLDVDSVPEDPDEAARRVVVGTVMIEPVLLTLRLLAQREISVRRGGVV